jgi:exosortase/archaeosortase family protein
MRPPAAPAGARRAALGFIARFVAAWLAVVLLTAFVPGIEQGAVAATVACMAWLLHATSIPTPVMGDLIVIGSRNLQITAECTPLFPTAVLWSAMVAFPAPPRWRLLGAAAGAATLWIYNLVRVLAMVGVVRFRPAWFEFVHVVLWQTITLVVVIGMFVLWLRMAPQPATSRTPAG